MSFLFVKCDKAFSFFKLCDLLWRGQRPKYTIHRVCNLMRKMGAESLLVETVTQDYSITEWPRIQVELEQVSKRLGRTFESLDYTVHKLTFFCEEVRSQDQLASLNENAFLGYVIIVNLKVNSSFWCSYVFESILREKGRPQKRDATILWEPLLNHFLHVKRAFSASAIDREYSLHGSYFCQQNGITTVCAHACGSMVLTNALGGNVVPCEVFNERLNVDQQSRQLYVNPKLGDNSRATHKGLDLLELDAVFRQFKFNSYREEFNSSNRNFREFLYGFIESGYPALLVFNTSERHSKKHRHHHDASQHVVPVFGHTLNSDSWFPLAFAGYSPKRAQPGSNSLPDISLGERSYLSTVDWVDDFIIHDDNYGMQLAFPAHAFRPEGRPDPGLEFSPIAALGIYPNDIDIKAPAHSVERIACQHVRRACLALYETRSAFFNPDFSSPHYYFVHFLRCILSESNVAEQSMAVFRTLLVKRQDYIAHLRQADNLGRTYTESEISGIESAIGNRTHVWLVEVTEPDLYVGNKSKLIDVIFDPNVSLDSLTESNITAGLLLIRFPVFALQPNQGSFTFLHDQSRVVGHMPFFTKSNSRPPHTVW